MRLFWLVRSEDESGVSGTGIVAEGGLFDDGSCVLSWIAQVQCKAFYPSLHAIEHVHGHGGKTKVVFNLPMLQIRRAA